MDETTTVTETLTTLSLQELPLPNLPFDLVAEILCRLPVKLLLQLRCLCKSFNTLISDPKFTKKHLHMSSTRHCLLLFSIPHHDPHVLSYPLHSRFNVVTDYATRHNYPFTFKKKFHYMVGSCDGMFCLEVNDTVILWNPSIEKFKTLPSLGGNNRVAAYGFGFDTIIDNYKVVSVIYNRCSNKNHEAKIKVHTLGTNSWRMIPSEVPVPISRSLKLASGTLNWFASNDDNDDNDDSIVSFDLGNESYQKLLPPQYGGEGLNKANLDVLRDCLCIFAHSHTYSSVWMMREYGNQESWTKLFCVPQMKDPFYERYTPPIWISDDDLVLLMKKEYMSGSLCKKKLALCDFKNGAFDIQNIHNMDNCIIPKVYIESLVSPGL